MHCSCFESHRDFFRLLIKLPSLLRLSIVCAFAENFKHTYDDEKEKREKRFAMIFDEPNRSDFISLVLFIKKDGLVVIK